MMVNLNNLLCSEIQVDFDENKIKDEILSCRKYFKEIIAPQDAIKKILNKEYLTTEPLSTFEKLDFSLENCIHRKNLIKNCKTLYLRTYQNFNSIRYTINKIKTHNMWYWNPDIANFIPYTISIINLLPLTEIGCVRTIITEGTFLFTHNDGVYEDYEKNLALHLVISNISSLYVQTKEKLVEIKHRSMLFNDSLPHCIPYTDDIRIDIRIFGKIDKEKISKIMKKETIILK